MSSEPDEQTKRKRHYGNTISDWALAKIAMNKLQEKAFAEDLKRKWLREDQLDQERKSREEALHNLQLKRTTALLQLEAEEIRKRINCLKEKHQLELEILQLQKSKLL